MELLQENLKFGTRRNRFWERNSIEEEIELRKQTRKKIDNIERLKTEIKEIKEWELKSAKLLEDLNFEKGVEITRIEIRLETLGISKTAINAIKKLIIPKKYLYLIL